MWKPEEKPVVAEEELDGTIKTLLLVALDRLEKAHAPIHRDALQFIIFSALAGQLSYEGTKKVLGTYIDFY